MEYSLSDRFDILFGHTIEPEYEMSYIEDGEHMIVEIKLLAQNECDNDIVLTNSTDHENVWVELRDVENPKISKRILVSIDDLKIALRKLSAK